MSTLFIFTSISHSLHKKTKAGNLLKFRKTYANCRHSMQKIFGVKTLYKVSVYLKNYLASDDNADVP